MKNMDTDLRAQRIKLAQNMLSIIRKLIGYLKTALTSNEVFL